VRHEAVGRLRGHAWEQLDLPRHVRGDVLFCPGNTAPVLCLFGRTRVVATVHDLSYRYFPEAYSLSFRFLYGIVMPLVLRHAAAVITVSEAERASIAKHYPHATDRMEVIPNGGMPVGALPEPHRADADPYVLYVGSLSKRKNFPAMLRVAASLVARRPLKFVFIGGTDAVLKDSPVTLSEAERKKLLFPGQVNDWDTLRHYYSGAQVFFFPSLYESSGLPPIEAMGCGCPVLASSIPALTERCGEAALYCDPFSTEDMVRKLEQLLDDSSLRDALRERGYERAFHFTWRRCAEETLALLTRVRQSQSGG
jgi:glycosyltransferase involved in cell wall biosynthesis